jgi:hypothetical protein
MRYFVSGEESEVVNLSPPDTYDASEVGLGFTKNHYNQIFSGTQKILTAWENTHNHVDNTSVLHINTAFLSDRLVVNLTPEDLTSMVLGTKIVKTLGELEENSPVFMFNLSRAAGPTSSVSGAVGSQLILRTAFDDVNSYVMAEFVTSGITNTRYTYQIEALNVKLNHEESATVYSAPNLVAGTTKGNSIYNSYTQLRNNMLSQLGRFTRDHNVLDGSHTVPMSNITGYSKVYDHNVSAPSGVGQKSTILISSTPSQKYFFPWLQGQADSGIVAAFIGYSSTGIYLILERRTAGTTNTFRACVYAINDV